ncbi:MAG: choice-of-anchor D domain-containing protein [Deltaproteobacteria bacterium]|nr:choice-of-anchor D domain-containing protein [Deltaproteobacteria bacterium]
MRRTMHRAVLLTCALGWLMAGCAESDETYALITVDNAAPAVGPITHVELQVSAGGRMATHQLRPSTGELTLPTSISLHASGTEALDITAVAHGASGVLERGSVHTTLVDGTVNRITVTLGRHTVEGDGGVAATLSANPTKLEFGPVAVGSTSTVLAVEISNNGGQPSAVLAAEVSSSVFTLASSGCVAALGAGERCSIGVTLTPVAPGAITGTLMVGGLSIDLAGTGVDPGALKITPGAHTFAATALGQSAAPASFTITNDGALPLGNLSVELVGAQAAAFSTGDNTCQNQGLDPGASCTVEVRFRPDTVGAAGVTLVVSELGGVSNTAALMGAGVPPSALAITGMGAFGPVELGSSSATEAVFTISNGGGADTGSLMTTITGANQADFSAVAGCQGPLASGVSCTVRVSFTPRARGDRTARLTVAGAPGGTVGADLGGSGLAPANLVLSPSSYDFGITTIGLSASQTLTLSNQGDVAASFMAPTVAAPFSIGTSTVPCVSPLAGGATCSIEVTFTPTSVGSAPRMLSVVAGGSTLHSNLSGSGAQGGQLVAGPSAGLDFPATLLAATAARQRITITNSGGSPTGLLAAASIGGSGAAQFELDSDDCVGRTLAASASCDIWVRFHPTARGNHSATLNVSATPGGTTSTTLRGQGQAPGALAITAIADFGSVALTTSSATRTVTVTNTGDVALSMPVALSRGGSHAGDFALSGTSACAAMALAAGASCNASVAFAPTATGTRTASLVASAGAATAMTGLTGTGITQAALTVAPATHNFGGIPRNTSGPEVVFTVTNGGQNPSGALTVSLPGSDFRVASTTCSATLSQSQTCQVRVVFQPQSVGTKTATLSITANPGGAAQASLTGLGQAPAQLAVQAPNLIDVGLLETGTSQAHTFTISNSGEVATSALTVAAVAAPFSRTTTCGAALAPGASCTVTMTFAPGSTGAASGSVQVTASTGGSAVLTLSGTAVVCLSNARCGGGTPFCDASSHTCRGCTGDGECSAISGGATPACSGGTCVRCTTASHCGGGLQCNGSNACVECTSNEHCTGSRPICNFGNTCQACSDDSQCALKNANVPFCVNGECKQCTSSTQCGGGETCFSGFCQCPNVCTTGRCGIWNDCHGESVDCGDPCTGSLDCCYDSGRCTLPSSC